MSKVLKFIVHFVVICTILCVVALAAPPFFGVTTVIMDDTSKETNLPIGSVTYAIPVKTEDVKIGDPILVQENSKAYRYNISNMDLGSKMFTVVDPTVSEPKNITVAVKNYVPKVVITIGLLGYLLVATESIEGLIVLGLAVLFLVILYVIAELWKKEPQEYPETAEDPEPGYIKSEKELRREEKEKARLMKEEERQIRREDKQRRKEEKRVVRTGGFVDEIYEDDLAPEEPERPVTMQTATSEAHELLKKEIAAATAEEGAVEAEAPKPVQESAPVREKVQEAVKEADFEDEEPVEIKKMAIPAWSAAQLADRAKQEGDAPEIVRDDITNVTLFDYSDIIGEDDGGKTEE